MNLKKFISKIGIFFILLSLIIPIVFADEGHPAHDDFEQAEAIINAEIPCDMLTEEQLEYIGDYYMEQMHPGEAHDIMDQRLSAGNPERLRQMHIHIANMMYCGEHNGMMMGVGMMNGMMGWNWFYGMGLWMWLFWIAVIGFIIWVIYKLINKKGGK